MSTTGSNSSNLARLRMRAEALLSKYPTAAHGHTRNHLSSLVEELRTHQVEIEMQEEELRRTCEELDRAKTVFEDLYDFAPVGFITLNEHHLIARINYLAARLLGKAREDLLGKAFSRYITPEDVENFHLHCEQCFSTGKQETCELKLKPGGSRRDQRHVQLESRAIRDDEEKYTRIRTALIDVTTRKRDEERIRTLGRELLASQERERQMISCELHDRIAQDLSAVKMGCDSFFRDTPEIPPAIRAKASKLSERIKAVITAVRELSYELRPPDLARAKPSEVIDRLCREFSNDTGIETDFYSTGMECLTLDPFAMTNIYRMFQEGLVNVRKHAEATHVHASLSYSHPHIIIRITDNGKGFDVEKRESALTRKKRMGLRSMKERARLLSGNLTVKSSPMRGTEVHVRIPYGEKIHG